MTIIEKRHKIIHNLMHTDNIDILDTIDDILEPHDEYEIPIEVQKMVLQRRDYARLHPETLISHQEITTFLEDSNK